MDCEEERRRVVEWATIDPIASAMDVDFWMRERRLRDGGYRWQRRGGGLRLRELERGRREMAGCQLCCRSYTQNYTVPNSNSSRLPIQSISTRETTPLSMAKRDSHDYRIPPSWPNIFAHTQTHCSIIPSCRFVSSTSQVVSDGFFPPYVWSIFFDIDSGCRRIYVQVPPPRHSWEKFRQVPAVATPILWIKRKFIMWRGDRI
jgi:hypothetical protein